MQQTRRSLALLFDGHYHRLSRVSETKPHSKEERQAALLFYSPWLLSLFSRLKRLLSLSRISQLTRKQDEQEHRKNFCKLQKRVHFALECVDQANLYNKYKKHRKNDRSFSFHVSSVCGLRFVSCLTAILPYAPVKHKPPVIDRRLAAMRFVSVEAENYISFIAACAAKDNERIWICTIDQSLDPW